MKKQLLLTIMVGYVAFISVNLNAADFASLNPNDSPYFLTASDFDNYVQQKALRTAGYTALLGACAGTAYFYSKPSTQTIKNIALATTGTLAASGLSFCISYISAQSVKNALLDCIRNSNSFLLNSLNAIGLNAEKKMPTIKEISDRIEQLTNLLDEKRSMKTDADLAYIFSSQLRPGYPRGQQDSITMLAVKLIPANIRFALICRDNIRKIQNKYQADSFFTSTMYQPKWTDQIKLTDAIHEKVCKSLEVYGQGESSVVDRWKRK